MSACVLVDVSFRDGVRITERIKRRSQQVGLYRYLRGFTKRDFGPEIEAVSLPTKFSTADGDPRRLTGCKEKKLLTKTISMQPRFQFYDTRHSYDLEEMTSAEHFE